MASLTFLAPAKGCEALKECPLSGRLSCNSSVLRVGNNTRKAFTLLSMCNNAIATAVKPAIPSGLNKCCRVSPQLQRIVGEAEMPRNQVVKQVWAYIKEKNLQNPNSKTEILCDEAMTEIFGVDKIRHMELNVLLSGHLTYEGGPSRPKPKPKTPKPAKAAKPVARSSSPGITRPVPISEALRQFLGVTETKVSRPQVVKLVWDYIKKHDLQDSNNKRNVICDSKLRELLQCDSLLGITMTKYLAPHFLMQEKQ